jgi:hypothetical protein
MCPHCATKDGSDPGLPGRSSHNLSDESMTVMYVGPWTTNVSVLPIGCVHVGVDG